MARKQAPGSTAKAVTVQELHGIKVGEQLVQNVDGHPERTDSPEFVKARTALHKILAELGDNFFGHADGDEKVQAHHGGSIWVKTDEGWLLFLNLVGIEWNEQFGADPAKVDRLRRNAKAILDAFPKTRPALKELGYDPDPVLDTPVTDTVTLSRYVDSLFNACVPLPQKVHTGTLSDEDARSCGIHHFPVPAWAMNFVCRPDFKPYVPVAKGVVAHVAAVSHDPADKRVRVLAVHGNKAHALRKAHAAAEGEGKALVLDETDPVSKAAFIPAPASTQGPAQGT